jgi:hypothetical protein
MRSIGSEKLSNQPGVTQQEGGAQEIARGELKRKKTGLGYSLVSVAA